MFILMAINRMTAKNHKKGYRLMTTFYPKCVESASEKQRISTMQFKLICAHIRDMFSLSLPRTTIFECVG